MSRWFAKRRQTRRDPLRRRLEFLEPRSLLSGQALCALPAEDAALAAADSAPQVEPRPTLVVSKAQGGSAIVQVSLESSPGMWLAFRTHNGLVLMSSAAPTPHADVYFGRAHHESVANSPLHENSQSLASGATFTGDRSRVQVAPYGGPPDSSATQNGLVPPPGFVVMPVTNALQHAGSTSGRPPGAYLMSAVNAFAQAVASKESFSTNAEAAALMAVSVIDARQVAAATAPNRTPVASTPSAPAQTAPRNPLTGNPDGGFAAIGGAGGLDRAAADAALDTQSVDALTEAELEWLTPEMLHQPRERDIAESASVDAAAPLSGAGDKLAVASFDQGMIALPAATDRHAQRERGVIAALEDAPIEMAATAALFQAFELGFETPAGRHDSHGHQVVVRSAALVSLSGDATSPEESNTQLSERVLTSAIVGMAGFEFLRRRRRNQSGEDDRTS